MQCIFASLGPTLCNNFGGVDLFEKALTKTELSLDVVSYIKCYRQFFEVKLMIPNGHPFMESTTSGHHEGYPPWDITRVTLGILTKSCL